MKRYRTVLVASVWVIAACGQASLGDETPPEAGSPVLLKTSVSNPDAHPVDLRFNIVADQDCAIQVVVGSVPVVSN